MKKVSFLLILFIFGAFPGINANTDNNSEPISGGVADYQDPITLPKGTILFLISTKVISAQNFNAGDHFFVELEKDVTSKGKVIIPAGTIVQMLSLIHI